MRFFGWALALILWAGGVFAQSSDAIEDVIGSQLEAFNSRDVAGAWEYAAPNIQGMFGNSQVFGTMVERGYPMVWTNREVQFLDLRDLGSVQLQRLMLQDSQGGFHWLEYQMVETGEGWRIAGVQILPAPDVGT